MTAAIPYEATPRIRDACLCLHIQRAARILARRFDEAFRLLDLTNGQFSLLMSLHQPDPVPMRVIARLLSIDRTTLTAALKPLVRRGLTEIVTTTADRRARNLRLTDDGRDLLAKAVPIWEATHAAVEQALPGQTPDALRKSLRSI